MVNSLKPKTILYLNLKSYLDNKIANRQPVTNQEYVTLDTYYKGMLTELENISDDVTTIQNTLNSLAGNGSEIFDLDLGSIITPTPNFNIDCGAIIVSI